MENKKNFEAPVATVIVFDEKDVIVTSNTIPDEGPILPVATSFIPSDCNSDV